jgi:Bacterial TSP3 repeat
MQDKSKQNNFSNSSTGSSDPNNGIDQNNNQFVPPNQMNDQAQVYSSLFNGGQDPNYFDPSLYKNNQVDNNFDPNTNANIQQPNLQSQSQQQYSPYSQYSSYSNNQQNMGQSAQFSGQSNLDYYRSQLDSLYHSSDDLNIYANNSQNTQSNLNNNLNINSGTDPQIDQNTTNYSSVTYPYQNYVDYKSNAPVTEGVDNDSIYSNGQYNFQNPDNSNFNNYNTDINNQYIPNDQYNSQYGQYNEQNSIPNSVVDNNISNNNNINNSGTGSSNEINNDFYNQFQNQTVPLVDPTGTGVNPSFDQYNLANQYNSQYTNNQIQPDLSQPFYTDPNVNIDNTSYLNNIPTNNGVNYDSYANSPAYNPDYVDPNYANNLSNNLPNNIPNVGFDDVGNNIASDNTIPDPKANTSIFQNKKFLIIGGIVVVLLLVILIGLSLFGNQLFNRRNNTTSSNITNSTDSTTSNSTTASSIASSSEATSTARSVTINFNDPNGPTPAQVARKTNETTLPTAWLNQYFSDLVKDDKCSVEENCGANSDSDKDGLSNIEEYNYQSNPNNPDTDKDGLADGDEVNIYTTDPVRDDSTSNSINDFEEIKTCTDPALRINSLNNKLSKAKKDQFTKAIAEKKIHEPTISNLKKVGATDTDLTKGYLESSCGGVSIEL